MRFMFIIYSACETNPPPELMEAMFAVTQREVAAGRMLADGGLAPPALGKALRTKGGKTVALDGPFAETKEVVVGFSIIEAADLDEAVARAREYVDLNARYNPQWDGVWEVRPIIGSQVELLRPQG